MSNLHGQTIQRLVVYGVAVVLRGNLHLAGKEILYRLIGAAMTEFQLVGVCSQSEGQQLMAKADAEDRQIVFLVCGDQLLYIFDYLRDILRVAGTV